MQIQQIKLIEEVTGLFVSKTERNDQKACRGLTFRGINTNLRLISRMPPDSHSMSKGHKYKETQGNACRKTMNRFLTGF